MIRLEVTSRIRERARELAGRAEQAAVEGARVVVDELKEEAVAIATERIAHPSESGGYLDSFEAAVTPRGTAVEISLRNTSDHASFVERGRAAGHPVEKTYADNAENRRRGRVGASYVARYTGMPPAGIFGDGGPDWARRNKIARDGILGRFVFRDLRARYTPAEIASLLRREIAPRLLGR